MKKVLIIGSGIAGLSCAISCAEKNMEVTLVSPFPSERSQSVLAAGGINAVTNSHEAGDCIESHINLKVEKYILKRSCLSNADFIEIQGIAGGDLGIPSAVVKLS